MVGVSYQDFTSAILNGEEGCYFSVKSDQQREVYWGTGEAVSADFDKGPFPLFSTHSFTGEKSNAWHFSEFKHVVNESRVDQIETLEALAAPFELKTWDYHCSETKATYTAKVRSLQGTAGAGQFWVANFTQSVSGDLPQDIEPRICALQLFYNFLKLGHNHCGGVVITREQIFCSFSPETFITQRNGQIHTFPIKGTGDIEHLSQSSKEISELHMITDLMRNDLGQICHPVWVEQERYLTPEPNFHHARAEVRGQMKSTALSQADYKKLLPAGSISGAPKVRVVQLLSETENFERDYYTGTFGLRLNSEESHFNILIRTLFLNPVTRSWTFPVGGGITIESDPEAEWEESLKKAQILKDCLDS